PVLINRTGGKALPESFRAFPQLRHRLLHGGPVWSAVLERDLTRREPNRRDGSESVGSFSGGRMQANGAEAYGLSPPRSSHHSTHRNRVQAREACGRPEDGGSAGVGTARLIHGCHDQSYCAPICDCFYSEGSCAVDKDRTAAGGCGELGRCESRPYIVGYERVSDATLRDPGRWSTASWGRDSVAESLHERRHLTPCHRIIGAELSVRGRVAPSSDPLVGQPRDVVVEH